MSQGHTLAEGWLQIKIKIMCVALTSIAHHTVPCVLSDMWDWDQLEQQCACSMGSFPWSQKA
jgi:hypothetical protein